MRNPPTENPHRLDAPFEVNEIIEPVSITKVGGTPGFVTGVIHHEGRKIPIVDLNLKFGLGTTRCGEKSRILVVQVHETEMGLLADEVKRT